MIDFIDVYKSYGERVLLDNVSFRINPGDHIGVVGPNGAGKSTIFGIICNEISVDRGKVLLPSQQRIGYLKQNLPPESIEKTVVDFTADALDELKMITAALHEIEHQMADNPDSATLESLLKRHGNLQTEFEHLGGYRLRTEAESALCGLGFKAADLTRPMKTFSGGWQMRAALARTLITEPDILLLDEPSNYLDIPAIEWLCRFLRSFNGTMLLISHDRFLLNRLTTLTLEINSGHATRYPGNYDFYRREREERQYAMESAKRNQDRKRKELQRNIDRFRAKSSKAAQAQSWQKELDKLEDIVVPESLSYHGTIRLPEPPPSGVEAARFENISFAYPQKPILLENISLQIQRGDKIAFIGYNGMGKTTLLKLLTGKLQPLDGEIKIGHNVIMGYQAQEFADVLEPEQSAFDVVRNALKGDFTLKDLPGIMGSFGFSGDDMNKPCKVLSGGEKIRLCFARIFVNPPNLLILDEPTTHLDISAREALQAMLHAYSGSVCLVSHDIEFVRNVANTIVAMRTPTIKKYFGNYDYYLQKMAEENALNTELGNNNRAKNANTSDNDNQKDKRRERAKHRQSFAGEKRKYEKSVADWEEKIEAMELRQSEIIEELSSNVNIDFAVLNRELIQLKNDLENATQEWENAAEKLEEIIQQSNNFA